MAGGLLRKMGRRATIETAGGALGVTWRESDGHVTLSGPAMPVYRGVIPYLAALAQKM